MGLYHAISARAFLTRHPTSLPATLFVLLVVGLSAMSRIWFRRCAETRRSGRETKAHAWIYEAILDAQGRDFMANTPGRRLDGFLSVTSKPALF